MSYGLTEPSSGSRPNMRKHKLPLGLIGVLGVVLALAVAYVLMLPAFSSSSASYCGSDEHTHDEACFSQALNCGYPEEDFPVEDATHQHGEECYSVEKVLVCAMNEVSDIPGGDEAVAEASDMPSEDIDPTEDGSLPDPQVDPEAPTNETHVHDESCYEEQRSLFCELPEGKDQPAGGVEGESSHVHSDACYESALACELTEHTHDLQCFSNPSADLETPTDWESTLPAKDSLTGVWADDLIAVAESQLGYNESIQNYLVVDGDKTKGYTRYGEWYGDAYGDWCAMFVSFCLNYAGISIDAVPRDSNCQSWIEQLSGERYQMYYPVGTYAEEGAEPFEPAPGDIVFFDWNGDAVSDHVGIVAELIEAIEVGPLKIKTIEGNSSDKVRYREYELTDTSIMGYASLPINNGEQTDLFAEDLAASQTRKVQEGEQLYHVGNWTYQSSWHTLGGLVRAFALVPVLEGYSSPDDFTPKNWTADAANANYVVTYCVDKNTEYAIRLGEYSAYKLDNSRFPEKTQQRLAAIVMHAYPYITAKQMRDNMTLKYPNLANCHESELIAGVQQAIWAVANPTTTLAAVTFPSGAAGYKDVTVNFLEQSSVPEGHRDGSHIADITEYLLNLDPLVELEILTSNPKCTPNADGLYDLTVEVTLTRAVYPDENVSARLVAGEKSSQLVEVSEGKNAFVLSINDLNAEELADSEASIMVDGQRVQAYFYDSSTHQDMLGGNWEQYTYDLSFAIGSPDDLTSVSVTKVWANGSPGMKSVEVSLLANGVQCGEPVYLNAENGWRYVWTGLPKKNLLKEDIVYTVSEKPVDGYLSSVELSDAAIAGKVWQEISKTDDFVDGGEYVLMFTSSGALSWLEDSRLTGNNGGVLGWERVSLANASIAPKNAIWIAEKSADGVALKNAAKEEQPYLSFSNRISFSATGNSASCLGGYLKGGGWYYFKDITSYGYGSVAYSEDIALPLKVYRLVDAGPSTSNINYVITNYKEDITTEPVDVSVEKRWVGDRNGEHPESVTVYLLQNGKRYGEPVTLSDANDWSYRWGDLPSKYQSTSVEITYAIEEIGIDGYTSSVTAKADDPYSFVVTNTKELAMGDLSIKKVSSSDTSKALVGAEFDLYIVDEAIGEPLPKLGIEEPVVKFNSEPIVVEADGVVTVENVEIGNKCYLVETKSPDGYNLLSCPVLFTVSGSTDALELSVASGTPGRSWAFVDDTAPNVLVVKNADGYALPKTGGVGVAPLMTVGMILLAGASFLLLRRRSEERRPLHRP